MGVFDRTFAELSAKRPGPEQLMIGALSRAKVMLGDCRSTINTLACCAD